MKTKLRPHVPAIIAHVAKLDEPWAAALIEHLRHVAAVCDARTEWAAVVRRERSESIRESIRLAIGSLPNGRCTASIVLRRMQIKGPGFYGLKKVPSLPTIRAVLRTRSEGGQTLAPDLPRQAGTRIAGRSGYSSTPA